MQQIDLIELNEAFASQSLAVIRTLNLNNDIVNINGGAIALGHPLGCTGCKLTIQIINDMKRLNKKVWLLQYNGEAHNLMERRNRKDLSIRLGQFFGYYLKDEKPASWITNGLPATQKGKSWGTD